MEQKAAWYPARTALRCAVGPILLGWQGCDAMPLSNHGDPMLRGRQGTAGFGAPRQTAYALVGVATLVAAALGVVAVDRPVAPFALLAGAVLLATLCLVRIDVFFALAIFGYAVVPEWLAARGPVGPSVSVHMLIVLAAFAQGLRFYLAPNRRTADSLARVRWVDIALLVYAATVVFSVRDGTISGRLAALMPAVEPVVLYYLARFCWTRRLSTAPIAWAAVASAAALSLSILAEAALGRVIFVRDATTYSWAGTASDSLRPAGFLGGAPLSGTVLVLLLCVLPIAWATFGHWGRVIVALVACLSALATVATLTRSPILGLVVLLGIIILARFGWVAVAAAAVLAPLAYVSIRALLAQGGRFAAAMTRSGTVEWRTVFREVALNKLAAADSSSLLFGAGFDSARVYVSGVSYGFANSFLTVAVAYGAIGLAGLIATLVAVSLSGLSYLRGRAEARAIGVTLLSLVACLVIGAATRDITNWAPVMGVFLLLAGIFIDPTRFGSREEYGVGFPSSDPSMVTTD